MNPDMILGLVRHILTFGGGYLISMGYLTEANVEAIIGALMTIVGVAWSIRQKQVPPKAGGT
jgi:hypothetical protein